MICLLLCALGIGSVLCQEFIFQSILMLGSQLFSFQSILQKCFRKSRYYLTKMNNLNKPCTKFFVLSTILKAVILA